MRHILIACALLVARTAFLLAEQPARRDEEVTFRSGQITIAGTLSFPAGAVRPVQSTETETQWPVFACAIADRNSSTWDGHNRHNWWLRPS
jgi:hypothetical protein